MKSSTGTSVALLAPPGGDEPAIRSRLAGPHLVAMERGDVETAANYFATLAKHDPAAVRPAGTLRMT